MVIKHKRKISNYLQKPKYQLKLGGYFFVFCFVSSLVMQWLIYVSIRAAIIDYHASGDSKPLSDWIDPSVTAVGNEYFVFLGIFALSSMLFGIWISHKVVGPSVALSRLIGQLQRGEYGETVVLRKGDQLEELANDLNQLSIALQKQQQGRKAVLRVLSEADSDEVTRVSKSA